tara:strand:+ start:229 stop:498 length:270 start_codon:yes stop_codon:yes gene_type:complete
MAKAKPYYGNFNPNKLLKPRQNYDNVYTAPDNTIKNLDGNHVVDSQQINLMRLDHLTKMYNKHKREQWFKNRDYNKWIDNTCNELEKLL